MKKLIDFWNKDIVNKLIILVALMLIIGVVLIASMLRSLPSDQLASLLGWDSNNPGAIPTMAPMSPTPTAQATPTTASFILPTSTPQPMALITATPGVALTPIALATELPQLPTATPFITDSATLGSDCIPANEAKPAKVVEIIDGYTIKVYMDGAVYTVRYAGIESEKTDTTYGRVAFIKNSDLVYGKEVLLIADETDQDPVGRLLRYVKVGNTFVNLELVRLGLATALAEPPNFACSQTLQLAELAARNEKVGQWSLKSP